MKSWKLPLIVAAIAVPIVAGFSVGGGGGLAVGSIAVVVLVLYAVAQRPRGRIESAATTDPRRHVLLVVTAPVEEPQAVARIVAAAGLGEAGTEAADILVLAPARIGFLDRWASDLEPARQAAQRSLVATVAALAKAGVKAEARVGDEDVVQAVEDQLQTYPATDVVLVSGGEDPAADDDAAGELDSRLAAGFERVLLS